MSFWLKGQSAIEYLMTYGWMLLVVAIVGGAIFATVGDQSIETISGFEGEDIALEDVGMTTVGMQGVVRSQYNDRVTVNEIRLEQDQEEVTVFPGREIGVLDTDTVNFPVFETERGTSTIDITFNYDAGGLTNLESSGVITGNYRIEESFSPTEWRTMQYDAQGTGYHPYTWGPREEPEIEWMVGNGSNYRSNPSLSEGILYQSSREDIDDVIEIKFNAYNAETGDVEWSIDLNEEGIGDIEGVEDRGIGANIYDNPEVTDDYVISWRRNNTLFIMDKEDGAIVNELEGQFSTYSDGIIYAAKGWHGEPINVNEEEDRPLDEAARFDDYLIAYDIENGDIIWEYEADFEGTGERSDVVSEHEDKRWIYRDGGISTSPLVDDEYVYGHGKGHTFALDRETGVEVWRTDIESGVRSKPAVDDDRIYLSSLDGWNVDESNTINPDHVNSTIWALDRETGDILWSDRTADRRAFGGPALYDDKVYHAGTNRSINEGYVYAMDQETGEQIWKRTFDWRDVWGSPFIADGIVYQLGRTSDDAESGMKALDAETGETVWEKDIGDNPRSTPTIGEGRLYISTRDEDRNHNLYALER